MEVIVGSGGESHSFATRWLLAPIYGELERTLPIDGTYPMLSAEGVDQDNGYLAGCLKAVGRSAVGQWKRTCLSIYIHPTPYASLPLPPYNS